MCRLMTGREAINELNDIINIPFAVIPCTNKAVTQQSYSGAQINRIRFLIDYVHGKLPVDDDNASCIVVSDNPLINEAF